jgi:hypothetical protein
MRLLLLVALLCLSPCTSWPIVVLQSMTYRGGVDLTADGVKRLPILYEKALVTESGGIPSDSVLSERLRGTGRGSDLVLDVERWPLEVSDNSAREENRQRLVNLLSSVRRVRPDLRVGYYDVAPTRPPTHFRHQWEASVLRARNDFAPFVDAIYPSLYALSADRAEWESQAFAMLAAARTFGKPVFCFLWPQYHENNLALRGQYIERPFWRMQLETCSKYADGIVLWNFVPNAEWDRTAPWWLETLDFLHSRGLGTQK